MAISLGKLKRNTELIDTHNHWDLLNIVSLKQLGGLLKKAINFTVMWSRLIPHLILTRVASRVLYLFVLLPSVTYFVQCHLVHSVLLSPPPSAYLFRIRLIQFIISLPIYALDELQGGIGKIDQFFSFRRASSESIKLRIAPTFEIVNGSRKCQKDFNYKNAEGNEVFILFFLHQMNNIF